MLKGALTAVVVTGMMCNATFAGPAENDDCGSTTRQGGFCLNDPLGCRELADSGNVEAQYWTAYNYEHGRVFPRSQLEAASWFQRAANGGDTTSMIILGFMYENGRGAPQDYILAHMWFNLAAARGCDGIDASRDRVAKLMTPDQITEAQRLAREWKPKLARP